MTSRRGFLGALLGGAAAIALDDPEKALWRPGKLISIPKAAPLAELPGFSIRFLRGFDVQRGRIVYRLDVQYGFPWAAKIPGGVDYGIVATGPDYDRLIGSIRNNGQAPEIDHVPRQMIERLGERPTGPGEHMRGILIEG